MLYSRNVKGNTSLIDELYKDVPIKSVNDMIRFYIRNCLLRPTYNENTILYLWDADNKISNRVMLKDKMSLSDIERLDSMKSLDITKKINSLF
jgi:CMP-N-acetylneuraminic acid synthetase